MQPTYSARPLSRLRLSGIAVGLVLASCSSDSDDDDSSAFEPRDTTHAVAAVTPIEVAERWLVYLADESMTGDPVGATAQTDFNGDADFLDSIPVVVDMVQNEVSELDVAAREVYLLGTEVYVVTAESDDATDWDADAAQDDLVLLHWSPFAPTLAFVDTLEPAGPVHAVVASERLYFSSTAALAATDTSLRFVDAAQPTTPTTVATTDTDALAAQQNHRAKLLGESAGLLLCALDETQQGTDLNFLVDPDALGPNMPDKVYDGDMLEANVLAVLDTTTPSGMLFNTGIALGSTDAPLRARELPAGGDWIVAALADESAYGQLGGASGGFNDINEALAALPLSWVPSNCALADADLGDHVLQWLRLSAWTANPLTSPVQNTGLAGVPTQALGGRIAIAVGATPFVATVQPEADQANCDLNGDADMNDTVVRWAEAAAPQSFFFTDESEIVAVSAASGENAGLFELENAFVALVDEAADGRDHDADPLVDQAALIGWLDPLDGLTAAWTFDHDLTATELFIDTEWIVGTPDQSALFATVTENTFSTSQNNVGTDVDLLDAIPALVTLDTASNDLDFIVSRVATDPGRAGMVVSEGLVFFRTDEAADSRDWNGDGDQLDTVLLRSTISTGFTTDVVQIASLDRPSLVTGSEDVVGGAFIAREADEADDLNGDGDMNDFVVRYFRF